MMNPSKTRKLLLTHGQFATIPAEEYERLVKNKYFFSGRKVWRSRDGGHGTVSLGQDLMSPPKGSSVVPIDGDMFNFRKENLIICTNSFKRQHGKSPNSPKTSKFRGVCWHKRLKKWRATIHKNGKSFWLGLFDTEEEAAKAYDAKARELFGEFAYQNFNNPVRPQKVLKLRPAPRRPHRLHSCSTSKFKGVSFCNRRKNWRAYIYYYGQFFHLGYFSTATEAAIAYDKKAKELFGESFYLNFPEDKIPRTGSIANSVPVD